MLEFQKWPEIPSFEDEKYFITEKIDGIRGCIVVTADYGVFARDKSGIITVANDNFGFAQWVKNNLPELLKLGAGCHYGEWWGFGIKRGYGLLERRFSLFSWWLPITLKCCHKVPLLPTEDIEEAKKILRRGSLLTGGNQTAEGMVIRPKSYTDVQYQIILDK